MSNTLSNGEFPVVENGSSGFSKNERIQIIYLYAECGYNAEEAARQFNILHDNERAVSGRYVRYLVSKFNNAGSIIDLPRSGRPRSTTDEHSALSVVQEAESEANLSVGKIAQRCQTSSYAVRRILKEKKLRRYRERQLQMLRSEDPLKRYDFCTWFLEFRNAFSVIFTDEAVFHLHGRVEKGWHWSRTNPRHFTASRSQNNPKIMVWAGILGLKIIGPYFISGNINGKL